MFAKYQLISIIFNKFQFIFMSRILPGSLRVLEHLERLQFSEFRHSEQRPAKTYLPLNFH